MRRIALQKHVNRFIDEVDLQNLESVEEVANRIASNVFECLEESERSEVSVENFVNDFSRRLICALTVFATLDDFLQGLPELQKSGSAPIRLNNDLESVYHHLGTWVPKQEHTHLFKALGKRSKDLLLETEHQLDQDPDFIRGLNFFKHGLHTAIDVCYQPAIFLIPEYDSSGATRPIQELYRSLLPRVMKMSLSSLTDAAEGKVKIGMANVWIVEDEDEKVAKLFLAPSQGANPTLQACWTGCPANININGKNGILSFFKVVPQRVIQILEAHNPAPNEFTVEVKH